MSLINSILSLFRKKEEPKPAPRHRVYEPLPVEPTKPSVHEMARAEVGLPLTNLRLAEVRQAPPPPRKTEGRKEAPKPPAHRPVESSQPTRNDDWVFQPAFTSAPAPSSSHSHSSHSHSCSSSHSHSHSSYDSGSSSCGDSGGGGGGGGGD